MLFRSLKLMKKYNISTELYLSCIYPKEAPQPMPEDCLLTSPLEYTNEPYAGRFCERCSQEMKSGFQGAYQQRKTESKLVKNNKDIGLSVIERRKRGL